MSQPIRTVVSYRCLLAGGAVAVVENTGLW
jgi:hypothetical protein